MFVPIWKDKKVNLGTATYKDFEIRKDNISGTLIYSGRAYARPGESDVFTKVNDICADWLANNLPNLAPGLTPMQTSVSFAVCVGGSVIETIDFYNDWSYDYDFDANTMPLAHPINYELSPNQWFFFSVLPGVNSVNAILTFEDNTTMTINIPVARTADFNDDFSADFSQDDVEDMGGVAVVDLSQFSNLVSVTIGSQTWKVRDNSCSKYAVYYVNAYGGWDSFLIDGYDSRRDDLVRHTQTLEYDNTDEAGRGEKDYVIEVSPAWVLRTFPMDDTESSRMHNLLNSNEIYLCELSTGHFRPIVLTDDSFERKSYRGNGRRINEYTFNAKLAQRRIRR